MAITVNEAEKKMLHSKDNSGYSGYQQTYRVRTFKEFRWIQIGTKYRISKKSFDEWLDKL